jgi:hypothetical protein
MIAPSEVNERLERIEALLLGMKKSETTSNRRRQECEAVPTQVCKVRYDVLAVNIKNKLRELFDQKSVESSMLEEFDMEELILSSLQTEDCNEKQLLFGRSSPNLTRMDLPPPPQTQHNNKSEQKPISTTTTPNSVESLTQESNKPPPPPPSKSEKITKKLSEAEKEARKAEKEAKDTEKKSEKDNLVGMRGADKESKDYEKAMAKRSKDPETAAQKKKAEKEALELKKKADKEALELKKKADKEAKELEKKLEKEAKELKKKEEKANKQPRKKASKDTTSTTTTTASQPAVTQSQIMEEPEVSLDASLGGCSSTTHTPPSNGLSLIKPSKSNQIIRSEGGGGGEEHEEEYYEENSTNTEDEEEEEEEEEQPIGSQYKKLENWSIPSKPDIVYFAQKGNYIYECVKSEEHPEGIINTSTSVGMIMGTKIVYTMNFKEYETLVIRT